MHDNPDEPATKQDLGNLKDEFESKLIATENRLQQMMTEQTQEILQGVAEMVQPMQGKLNNHEHRISSLEHKAA